MFSRPDEHKKIIGLMIKVGGQEIRQVQPGGNDLFGETRVGPPVTTSWVAAATMGATALASSVTLPMAASCASAGERQLPRMLTNRCRVSNQNGAPREVARAVISHPQERVEKVAPIPAILRGLPYSMAVTQVLEEIVILAIPQLMGKEMAFSCASEFWTCFVSAFNSWGVFRRGSVVMGAFVSAPWMNRLAARSVTHSKWPNASRC